MSTPENPQREHPSTYFVQDRSNMDELHRLQVQDQMLTNSMGGPLPEQPDPNSFQAILDIGCGTGSWLIETATTYPNIRRLVGVDISTRMLELARIQAQEAGVAERVEFHTMDILRMLEFPAESFDLVNQRFGFSYLRTWDWLPLLAEYRRVLRPGGTVRITESELLMIHNKPALSHLAELTHQAFHRAGHAFRPTTDGVIGELASLLQRVGFHHIQTRPYTLEYRSGTPEHQLFSIDTRHGYRVVVPFLRKWGQLPDDYETIYQQAMDEINQPDYFATWKILTAWGTI